LTISQVLVEEPYIKHFQDISTDLLEHAGGKGTSLTHLFQRGFPVPEGFIVFPFAFENDKLKPVAWKNISEELSIYFKKYQDTKFAVRSSALVEDSVEASFGGQFDTFLNKDSIDTIKQAIQDVYDSKSNERVEAYSQAKGITIDKEMAIVLQIMIPSNISGIIFTADPVTGNDRIIKGNYIHGLGDKLVSGEVDGFEFTINRNTGEYCGNVELKKFRKKILKLVEKIEKEFESPQDIEWAIFNKKLFILQSRPITNLITSNPRNGENNDSLVGDFLWSNSNAAEAVPDVMTPFSWSLWEHFHFHTLPLKVMRKFPLAGNICGRSYFNFSLLYSFYRLIYRNPERALQLTEEVLGRLPKEMPTNLVIKPFSKTIIAKIILGLIPAQLVYRKLHKQLPSYIKDTPEICRSMEQKFQQKKDLKDLNLIWKTDLKPYVILSLYMIRTGMNAFSDPYWKLKNKLTKLAGDQEAAVLLSNLSGENEYLESMGPVVGLFKIQQGKMKKEEYLERYGHRDPHECELLMPRPYEKTNWIESQLNEYSTSNLDLDDMIRSHR
jgi:hypothetical protein